MAGGISSFFGKSSGGGAAGGEAAIGGQIDLGLYFAIKAVLLGASYWISLVIANNMAQLYTERVFVDDKPPPALSNQVLLWAAFLGIFGAGIIAFARWGARAVLGDKVLGDRYTLALVYDLLIAVGGGGLLLWGIARTMYVKKYFHYKDDGLRIDYVFATHKLAATCSDVVVHTDMRARKTPSDHAPVTAVFEG